MKLTTSERHKIADNLKAAMLKREVNATVLAHSCGVDPSRVSKILAGNFATLNPTLMQICTFLDVPLHTYVYSQQAMRMVTSALRVWDGTPEDVEAVVELFDHLAAMRRRPIGGKR